MACPRLGMVITKKVAKLATQRNQIKRLIRESFRLNQQQLKGIDVMVVAYKDITALSKAELRKHLEQTWPKLQSFYAKL